MAIVQKITPCLWFDNQAEKAAKFYVSIFKHSAIGAITRYGKQQAISPVPLDHFESVTGLGLRARRDGHAVLLGKRAWALSLADSPHSSPAADAGFSREIGSHQQTKKPMRRVRNRSHFSRHSRRHDGNSRATTRKH